MPICEDTAARLQVQAAVSALLPSRRPRERALRIAVVIATLVIVGYGVAQYRWSREVSDAAAVRKAER